MKILDLTSKLTQQIIEKLPDNVKVLKSDLDKTIQQVLTHSLSKLNVVTREEFDVQAKVLARTREKVEALEKQLAALEQEKQDRAGH